MCWRSVAAFWIASGKMSGYALPLEGDSARGSACPLGAPYSQNRILRTGSFERFSRFTTSRGMAR